MKEIKCPGKDLEMIISNLRLFGNHDIKARLEPSMKEMEELVKSLHPKWKKKYKDKVTKIAFQDLTRDYVASAKIVGTLSRYGNTKLEIKKNVREHLMSCKECRLKYAKYLDEEAEKMIELVQEVSGSIDEKIEGYAQRIYINFLKAADIFDFMAKSNVYKA